MASTDTDMNVCVTGLGYIGLPLAGILASRGIRVHGVDIRSEVVDRLGRGEIHILEQGLHRLVQEAVAADRLTASVVPCIADYFVIAVPTPIRANRSPDISCVQNAIEAIAPYLRSGNTIIIESTCPAGTTEKMSECLQEARPDLRFPVRGAETSHVKPTNCVHMAYCPERVMPGRIVQELVANDRVVGGIDPASAEKAAAFYRIFVEGEVLQTDARSAEMCKLTENAFRDVNIAFANEISMICERLGVDPFELIEMANRHPRVNILQPGPGVGGHCIAVDPWFIVDSAPDVASLIRTARLVNDEKPESVIRKVEQLAGEFQQPTIACLGLTFKADVDDLRESPALKIVEALANMHIGQVLAVEPNISDLPTVLKNAGVELVSLDCAIERADIVLLLVNHKDFVSIDRSLLSGKKVIDTRGVWR